MNQQSFAILISCGMFSVFLLAVVATILFWTRTGGIRRSPLATRREKNVHHLVTIATIGFSVACTVTSMLIEFRIGGYFLSGTAFFALFVAPIRTVFVEMGLRRTNPRRPDATTPSSQSLG